MKIVGSIVILLLVMVCAFSSSQIVTNLCYQNIVDRDNAMLVSLIVSILLGYGLGKLGRNTILSITENKNEKVKENPKQD